MGIIRVKCKTKAYYRDQMRDEGSVINFYEEDKDKGVYRAGDKKGQSKPPMPSWAEIVGPNASLTVPESEERPEPATLHEIADKKVSKVNKPGKSKNR